MRPRNVIGILTDLAQLALTPRHVVISWNVGGWGVRWVFHCSVPEPASAPQRTRPTPRRTTSSIADDVECTCVDGDPVDGECWPCGEKACPFREPLHFHHDGCPACIEHEEKEESGAGIDPGYQRYLDECRSACRCCPECSPVSCEGVLGGGICDQMCRCGERELEDEEDRHDEDESEHCVPEEQIDRPKALRSIDPLVAAHALIDDLIANGSDLHLADTETRPRLVERFAAVIGCVAIGGVE
jgi:hypothetical protein